MYLISAEGYENVKVNFLTIKTTSEICVSMKDVGSGMGVKNISDLVLKEIYGFCETKNPTKEQVNEYKIAKRRSHKKFTNLRKKELNTKNNKNPYIRNDVMTIIIKRCRGEKARGIRTIDGFRKKLMIPDFEIPKFPEFEVKSKIGTILKKHNFIEKYLLKFIKLMHRIFKHYTLLHLNITKKIQVDKNGCKYILFKIDVYFNTFLSAVEIDEKGHTDRARIFFKKNKNH